MTEEQWDHLLDVNLKGTFLTNQAAFPYLREMGGRIVNATSRIALAAEPGRCHYAASKGGYRVVVSCAGSGMGSIWDQRRRPRPTCADLNRRPTPSNVSGERAHQVRRPNGRQQLARPSRRTGNGHRAGHSLSRIGRSALHHRTDRCGRRGRTTSSVVGQYHPRDIRHVVYASADTA